MKTIYKILLFSVLLIFTGCITQFFPITNDETNLLVVEGLITDQPEIYTIKLSTSMPLGGSGENRPLSGCYVNVSDDLGNSYAFYESMPGIYNSYPSVFQGKIGRSYILHINTNSSFGNHTYESYPVELKPVPPIDSLYYEKVTIAEANAWSARQEGCQVFLNTNDPSNICKFFRWEFSETWEFHLPYLVPNNICWVSGNSDLINVKSTSALAEDRIKSYPLDFISNSSDRLSVKYSILVSQYSLNEDEFQYWQKLQNVTQHVGGLYDIIPASIPSNITCVDDPAESILGYFSVSAKSTKRLFIKDHFSGLFNPYTTESCVADTVFNGAFIPNLNISTWVIVDHQLPPPSYKVTTFTKGCADCTVRGSNVKPDFWDDDK